MTFTRSEKRREIAATMRIISGEGVRNLTLGEVLNSILTGGAPRPMTDMDILACLADLIDPTCHVIGTTSQDWSDGSTVYTHDLSCGHMCRTDWTEPPAFCDECGARVVDDAF